VNVFFSAHGVPKSYVEEAGDPYKEEMEECVALIMAELRRRGRWVTLVCFVWELGLGGVEWSGGGRGMVGSVLQSRGGGAGWVYQAAKGVVMEG
jgi:hypothetical protein